MSSLVLTTRIRTIDDDITISITEADFYLMRRPLDGPTLALVDLLSMHDEGVHYSAQPWGSQIED